VKKNGKEKLAKAVVDTNVLVSGLFAETGAVAELMELWIDERFELVTSEEILSELFRVLHKPTIQEHFKPAEDDIIEYIDTIREKAVITADLYRTDRITKDPTDNKFLACALESKADYVVSGDKHLREIKHFHGVKIIDVKTFVERVRKE
jgi:putative PIN family toxin of toxin-antitoxin system